jgi:hypothetical protein
MELDFIHIPDDPVHVSRFLGQDIGDEIDFDHRSEQGESLSKWYQKVSALTNK